MQFIHLRTYLFQKHGGDKEEAMFYSEDLIEEVRSRNDIVDVINSYVSLKKKGNTYTA